MRSRIRSYSQRPSSLTYEISTGMARTRSPPRALMAVINAQGKVSSMPNSRPIRFFMLPLPKRAHRIASPVNVPRLRCLAFALARADHGVSLVRQVRAAGADLPHLGRTLLRERRLSSDRLARGQSRRRRDPALLRRLDRQRELVQKI